VLCIWCIFCQNPLENTSGKHKTGTIGLHINFCLLHLLCTPVKSWYTNTRGAWNIGFQNVPFETILPHHMITAPGLADITYD
jgi:hypothetical protein